MKKRSIETEAIHFGKGFGERGALNVPIYQNSTFAQKIPGVWEEYTYSRTSNPTEDALRKTISHLENGAYSVVFSSGLAAIGGVVELLESGDHIVSMADIYGGTHRLFTQFVEKRGFEFTFTDTTDIEAVKTCIKENTKMLYLETPSNPLLEISDIRALAELSEEKGLLLVVDNTMATPCFQRALDLGADIVVQSTSKYISGHTNVIGGTVTVQDEEMYNRLKFIRKCTGASPGPFDCYLTMLGIATLPLRMRQHESNAQSVAEYLQSHSKVKKVYYPGLVSHPQHELAKEQMSGFGGIVSFELEGGEQAATAFIDTIELFSLAISFGSVASLVAHPFCMSHKDIPREEKAKRGLSESLIRLSLGIEKESDLLEDIEKGLSRA